MKKALGSPFDTVLRERAKLEWFFALENGGGRMQGRGWERRSVAEETE